MLDDNPSPLNDAWARRSLAIALDGLARAEEAEIMIVRMSEVVPTWTMAFEKGTFTAAWKDREKVAEITDALRRLGMPE